jgi:hypothetical protein
MRPALGVPPNALSAMSWYGNPQGKLALELG